MPRSGGLYHTAVKPGPLSTPRGYHRVYVSKY